MLKMFYNGSLAKALMHLFPEIDVDLSKFENMPRMLVEMGSARDK